MFRKKSNVRVVRNGPAEVSDIRLRRDLGCGVIGCEACRRLAADDYAPRIDVVHPIMVPDTNIILHNIEVLEDPQVRNIVFLSTVLAESQNRNKSVYSRVQRLIADESKGCFVFANDRHESTYSARKEDETANDYSDRLIRSAAVWLAQHLKIPDASVFLVTHDRALRTIVEAQQRAELAGVSAERDNASFSCCTLRDFLEGVVGVESALLEKAAYAVVEGFKESASGAKQYQEHIDPASMAQGIQDGRLLKGRVKVSETSCFFGEIRGTWEGRPYNRVTIGGRISMNRCFHADTVCVEVLPKCEWRGPSKTSEPLDNSTSDADAIAKGYTPAGKVVGVFDSKRRQFCGSIDSADAEKADGVSGEVSVYFQPKSSNIPRIRMRTRQLTEIRNKRLVVVVDDWPSWSSSPSGHYIEVLGDIGDKDTEAKVILIENDIPHYDFSQAVYDCLPKGTWSVEASEEERRVDLRDLPICSVDPLGCRDIDDALHYRILQNGNLEVGVHIADVTHFLHEHTPMDEEAAKRSTSVYLVDRRINMLPQLLTENLCSIVANEDRYAFSIIWEFDRDTLEVKADWFGKTIIRNRAALYYGDAQKMIDNEEDTSEIAMSLKGLMRLSKHFKDLREKDGALFLASQEFKFKIDNDHVNPTDMTFYQTFEANSMIEEWMLYANAAAASKVYATYPQWTLLRRHQQPAETAFDNLNEALERKIGVHLSATTSLALNDSLNLCVKADDSYFNRLVRMLTTRCLKQAQYFCSSNVPFDEFAHFGLAMPIYTHFTSPIRRYADVIVHRQLAAAVGLMPVSDDHTKTELMNAIADNINYRHEQAQRAGRDSQNLFTGFFLRQYANSAIPVESGYIVKMTDTHVFVLVPKFGQEGRIPREVLPDNGAVFGLLDKVSVQISVRSDGDVMRTKLEYMIIGSEEGSAATPVVGTKKERAAEAIEDVSTKKGTKKVE